MDRAVRALTALVVAFVSVSASAVAGVDPAAQETLASRIRSIQTIDFEDITPGGGLLPKRARYTLDMYKAYTPRHVLTLNYSTEPSDKAFPGDTIGRYILSTTLLSRALHEPEPQTLKDVMAALPGMLNAEGYLGWVLPKDRADETGLSNVMWSNGLTEYCLWKKDDAALKMDRNIFAQSIQPIGEAYEYYYSPEKSDGKFKWVHCTGDTAQAYGIIDPATRGYALFPSPVLKQEINELIRLYRKIDPVAIHAQTHAVLFTTRGILRWCEIETSTECLDFAESLYGHYRQLAMTENYENYNWFGRPDWTEGCAIVDSFTVAMRLWRLTGKTEYLKDAQLILFNGLLANQKDGDFGTNNCVGPNNEIFLKPGKAAPWCCSVWGGKGLARALQYSYFRLENGVAVTIPGNSTVMVRLPDGPLTIEQTTGYPHEGGVHFKVLASESGKKRMLALFAPSWINRDSIAVAVNGQHGEYPIVDDFIQIDRVMKPGDVIEVQFKHISGVAPLLRPERTPGFHRYMHGPLVLGADTVDEKKAPLDARIEALGAACYRVDGVALAPLCDLTDQRDTARHAGSGSIQVLFRD